MRMIRAFVVYMWDTVYTRGLRFSSELSESGWTVCTLAWPD